MPDWFYRTVAQRGLFCLPDEQARAVALGTIGFLGRRRLGRVIIDALGHMRADERLATVVGGTRFPSPIGLGWRVDPEQRATAGLSCFGAGCIEIHAGPRPRVVRSSGETLREEGPVRSGGDSDPPEVGVPILVRSLNPDGTERVRFPSGAELAVVAWDSPPGDLPANLAGVVLQVGTMRDEHWEVQVARPARLLEHLRSWRLRLGAGEVIVVAGAVAGPLDAQALLEGGADMVWVDAGLVYRGPGLIKRCNEALLALRPANPAQSPPPITVPAPREAWFWVLVLGAALALGGAATLVLAFTRVLLPYDEHFLGLTSEALRLALPRLFDFMAHDRGTLAGTMLGLGGLYGIVGVEAVRRGVHGATSAVVASALTGFASFFAFFGFGYFDVLHAFVAVVLFQITVQIMTGIDGTEQPHSSPPDIEDPLWRRAQWGQLIWILHAVGLLIAGGVILVIGMTHVFVSEDLTFLCLSAEEAQRLDSRLVGVVAHDRATLGGMLLASGTVALLLMLWCFRRGANWVGRAMIVLGLPAYAAALGVHFWVGYTDWRHLVPAWAGCSLWAAGGWLSRGYLAARL
jgi:hypothetical protein